MKKTCTDKLWIYMKTIALHCIVMIIMSSAAFASTTPNQVLDQYVSISLNDASIAQTVRAIETVADVKFIYSQSRLNISKTVSIRESSIRLDSLLERIFIPLQIGYSIREDVRTITLFKLKTTDKPTGKIDPVMSSQDWKSIVSGRVIDALSGLPMAGVNVIIKGTTNGTTTDINGKFTIESDDKAILVFSFIGYQTQEAALNGRTEIHILLEEDVHSLDEVVVNGGYYETTKETQTGNIGKIKAAEIQSQPVANPLAAMQGRIPGLEITQQTGVPGGNFKVRIRGINSISNGNDPLYIIDGVPFVSTTLAMNETSSSILGQGTSPLNFINPSTIQSIEVLKDADATAIYGSRGANGVILITTNRGKGSRTNVNVSMYSGFARVPKELELLSTPEYLAARRRAFKNDKVNPTTSNARDLLVWDTTRYTNWQKELIGGTANTTDAQISINGGEGNTQFSVGSGYHRESTVFPGDYSDQRISLQTTLNNSSPNNKFKTSFSANYVLNLTSLPNLDLTGRALTLSPNAPAARNEDGSLSWSNWSNSYENPLAYTKREYSSRTSNLVSSATVSYQIMPSLLAKISLGYTDISVNSVSTTPISSLPPDPTNVNASAFSNSSFKNWIAEPQLNWKKQFGSSNFDVLIGSTFLSQTSEGLAQYAGGFSSEALMKNLASASAIATSTTYYSEYRYTAAFGRINYNLQGKYILNLTARRDGSSRFGPNRQFANFGAVGAAWLWSEEQLIKDNVKFLSFGKIRASFGTIGNDQLGDYQYLDTYSSSLGSYQGTIGLQPNRLSNPNFAWEVSRKAEASLDLGVLDNRVFLSTSVYRNRSSNQLVGFPLPAMTGFPSIQGNFPATVQNKGIELELTTRNVDHTNFKWTSSANLTIPRNELIAFPDIENFPSYNNRYVVGEPLSIVKRYNNTGVNPQTGIYTFEDVNQDNTLNVRDAMTVLFVGQKFYGGLSNSFQFRGFQFEALFQFVKQTGTNPTVFFGMPGTLNNNLPEVIRNTWSGPESSARYQRVSNSGQTVSANNRYTASQHSIVDASFIRLKNISLSYDLPSTWLTKIKMQSAKLFIRSQNLLTLTKYRGLDPETTSNVLPPLRVVTLGFNVTL